MVQQVTTQRQVLLDKLSEFLMVEQGGLELYRVALSRAAMPELQQRYQEFADQTDHHRVVLIRLIEKLGGDPSYISPTARLAQVKASFLLETSLKAGGLSQEEIEANDLENVLLAETKDHSDWHLLEQLSKQTDDQELKTALQEAVSEVEEEEDMHLEWAGSMLAQLALRMLMQGQSPSPERWQSLISGPVPPIHEIHPVPMSDSDGLLEGASIPAWQDAPAVRDTRG